MGPIVSTARPVESFEDAFYTALSTSSSVLIVYDDTTDTETSSHALAHAIAVGLRGKQVHLLSNSINKRYTASQLHKFVRDTSANTIIFVGQKHQTNIELQETIGSEIGNKGFFVLDYSNFDGSSPHPSYATKHRQSQSSSQLVYDLVSRITCKSFARPELPSFDSGMIRWLSIWRDRCSIAHALVVQGSATMGPVPLLCGRLTEPGILLGSDRSDFSLLETEEWLKETIENSRDHNPPCDVWRNPSLDCVYVPWCVARAGMQSGRDSSPLPTQVVSSTDDNQDEIGKSYGDIPRHNEKHRHNTQPPSKVVSSTDENQEESDKSYGDIPRHDDNKKVIVQSVKANVVLPPNKTKKQAGVSGTTTISPPQYQEPPTYQAPVPPPPLKTPAPPDQDKVIQNHAAAAAVKIGSSVGCNHVKKQNLSSLP